jgi:hypothetical protein
MQKKILNPVTGRHIIFNGKLHKQLVKKGEMAASTSMSNSMSTTASQCGGNPLLLALPALSDLVIPAGLSMASYYSNKYMTHQKDTPNKQVHISEQTGGGHTIIPSTLLNNEILGKWLKMKKISMVQPDTLIPAGIICAVYYDYIKITPPEKPIIEHIEYMVNASDLKSYMHTHKIKQLIPQTLLPFAIVMGPSVFHQLLIH